MSGLSEYFDKFKRDDCEEIVYNNIPQNYIEDYITFLKHGNSQHVVASEKVIKYVEILNNNINYPAFYSMCSNTSENLNSPSDRFQKGSLREKALDIYSDGRFKHVDKEGYDNIDIQTNCKIEWKTTKLLTEKSKTKKKYIEARIKNTMGNNTTCEINNPADIYLFGGKDGIVLCDYKLLSKYLHKSKDCISCKIPINEITIVNFSKDFEKEIKIVQDKTKDINYIEMRDEMQNNFLKNFK